MSRYLRLYAYFLRFSFSRAMEFRFDFFFRIGMDTLWYAVHLSFFGVLYLHTDVFGGLDKDQMYVFLAALFMADAIQMTMISNNMWWMPHFINRGDLDYYLVRPVSSLFFLSLREFAANSFMNLLMTFGFTAWALIQYPGTLELGALLLFFGMLAVGVFLQYLLQLIFTIPVFWLHSGEGVRQVSFALGNYSSRPHGIYKGWVRWTLVWILPYAVVVSFPVAALFASTWADRWAYAAHLFGITVVFLGVALWFWRRGLKAYASASS